MGTCLVVVLVVASAAVGVPTAREPTPCTGTIEEPADATTVISVQGFKFGGEDRGKQPAMLVGVGPRGEIEWVHHATRDNDVVWSYDVDPLENGNLFVTATIPGGRTLLYEYDPEADEQVWSETLNATDTHDADLLPNGEIVVANMRNNVGPNDTARDRIFVYNRTTEEIVWEWHFADHFDTEVGGNFAGDWTHVNDVDPVGDDRFLVSPRNFDQVLLVNRTTGEIDLRLGEDDDHEVLRKQHNPDYLESDEGDPTFLVADSENDRVVEYKYDRDDWNRTWELGSESLHWPRDADRLPNGNTLVADSTNHRVIEVTPEGEIVWEFYSPWLVYDVERIGTGDGSNGPTMADVGTTGSHELRGSAGLHDDPDALWECFETLQAFDGSPGANEVATDVATNGQSTGEATNDASTFVDDGAGTTEPGTADASESGIDFGAGPVVGVVVLALAVGLLARRRG